LTTLRLGLIVRSLVLAKLLINRKEDVKT